VAGVLTKAEPRSMATSRDQVTVTGPTSSPWSIRQTFVEEGINGTRYPYV